MQKERKALLIVFQGIDTSGKDRYNKTCYQCIQPTKLVQLRPSKNQRQRIYHTIFFGVFTKVPRAKGEIVIFNRSHYEDIIQPRVHKTIHKSIWSQRYEHINAFEKCLSDSSIKIIKFFLHISKEEQRKRLEERLN